MKVVGLKCFAYTKLDAGEIRLIKKTSFAAGAGSCRRNSMQSHAKFGIIYAS